MTVTVLVNGEIVTADEQFSVVEAIAIDGDRIIATGSTLDVLAADAPGAEVRDLGGATVIPGLIDNHNHFARVSERTEVRLEGVTSRTPRLSHFAGARQPCGNDSGSSCSAAGTRSSGKATGASSP